MGLENDIRDKIYVKKKIMNMYKKILPKLEVDYIKIIIEKDISDLDTDIDTLETILKDLKQVILSYGLFCVTERKI